MKKKEIMKTLMALSLATSTVINGSNLTVFAEESEIPKIAEAVDDSSLSDIQDTLKETGSILNEKATADEAYCNLIHKETPGDTKIIVVLPDNESKSTDHVIYIEEKQENVEDVITSTIEGLKDKGEKQYFLYRESGDSAANTATKDAMNALQNVAEQNIILSAHIDKYLEDKDTLGTAPKEENYEHETNWDNFASAVYTQLGTEYESFLYAEDLTEDDIKKYSTYEQDYDKQREDKEKSLTKEAESIWYTLPKEEQSVWTKEEYIADYVNNGLLDLNPPDIEDYRETAHHNYIIEKGESCGIYENMYSSLSEKGKTDYTKAINEYNQTINKLSAAFGVIKDDAKKLDTAYDSFLDKLTNVRKYITLVPGSVIKDPEDGKNPTRPSTSTDNNSNSSTESVPVPVIEEAVTNARWIEDAKPGDAVLPESVKVTIAGAENENITLSDFIAVTTLQIQDVIHNSVPVENVEATQTIAQAGSIISDLMQLTPSERFVSVLNALGEEAEFIYSGTVVPEADAVDPFGNTIVSIGTIPAVTQDTVMMLIAVDENGNTQMTEAVFDPASGKVLGAFTFKPIAVSVIPIIPASALQ